MFLPSRPIKTIYELNVHTGNDGDADDDPCAAAAAAVVLSTAREIP